MINKKVVIFNAPIKSGKDEVVDWLITQLPNARKMEFKTELIRWTCTIYGVTSEWWESNYTRDGKDLPRVELNGLSMRQALIHVSETVIKPNLGRDFFGLASNDDIAEDDESEYFLYSDGGFIEELSAIMCHRPLLIRIHRKGCEYDENVDSRGYVTDDILDAYFMDEWTALDINNINGEFEQFCSDVLERINSHFSHVSI